MSSAPAPGKLPPHQPDSGTKASDRIVVYAHSNLFYWWPIWCLGFLFAGITYAQDWRLAIVPAHSIAVEHRIVAVDDKGVPEPRSVLILPKGAAPLKRWDEEHQKQMVVHPVIYMSPTKSMGAIFVIVLLIVITITSVTFRGLWTVFILVSLIMLTIILAAAGWWEIIFEKLGHLSIHINLGGYLLIAAILFAVWLNNFLFLDRQTYMIFTPGQVRVRVEIGGEETVYDTTGMAVMKQRADLFRHWILGFGSGDLVIKPVGLTNPIEFDNVLRVGSVVTKIETMIKEKVVVRTPREPQPPGT